MKGIRLFALAGALCVAAACSSGPAPMLSCKGCKATINQKDPCAKCGTACSCGSCAKCCACPAK